MQPSAYEPRLKRPPYGRSTLPGLTPLDLARSHKALATQWQQVAENAALVAKRYTNTSHPTPLELAAATTAIICARKLEATQPNRIHYDRAHPYRLTDRQLEVLAELASGRTQKQIARALHIDLDTVKTHLRRAYRILGAVNSPHAIMIAVRAGLLQ